MTFEGVFNKPNNKRAAEALVKTMEQDSLRISGYYVNSCVPSARCIPPRVSPPQTAAYGLVRG
ncbi:MAG: hypothetical protein IKP54_08615 [Bacteroidales bacterium]|nr:hypothetical protein [Bacteroidales bacterium]